MEDRFKNGVCVDIMLIRDKKVLLMKRKILDLMMGGMNFLVVI